MAPALDRIDGTDQAHRWRRQSDELCQPDEASVQTVPQYRCVENHHRDAVRLIHDGAFNGDVEARLRTAERSGLLALRALGFVRAHGLALSG